MTAIPRPTGIQTRTPWSDIEAGLWRVLEGRPEFAGLGLHVYRGYDGNLLMPDPQTGRITASTLPAVLGELAAILPQRQPRAWRDRGTWRIRGLFPSPDRADAEEFFAVVTGILGDATTGWQTDADLRPMVFQIDLGAATIEPVAGLSETAPFLWQCIVEISITTAPYRGA